MEEQSLWMLQVQGSGNHLGKYKTEYPQRLFLGKFQYRSRKNGIMTADIYLLNGNPVVPAEDGIYDFRVSLPDSCKNKTKY